MFRGKFPELSTIDDLRVLATRPGGSASNLLNIGGLRFSSGLSRRGYIYTDKSAYQPGESAAIRGIIREVADGSYVVPEHRDYTVRISDPAGRLLGELELALSKFGSFDTAIQLPPSAALGTYSILAQPRGKAQPSYQGTFTVQQFRLDRVRLSFEFPQQVYFRGEVIEPTLSAEYYWGSPAADTLVEITFPDGRRLTEKTGPDGELKLSLDTSGFIPGKALNFSATIPSLNVSASSSVFLANLGYRISLEPDQPLALANEAFEVQVETRGADGEPVGKNLTITVLRSELQKPDPVLEAVPWIAYNPQPAAQVTVEEINVSTDAETGKGTAILNLAKGGAYTLRASGQDRFDQTVTAQAQVRVSDDEDAQKLRFFAEKSSYDVGSEIPLRLHSRVAKGLALLTFEGEEILGHRIISIDKGDNRLVAPVEHAHFPNFRVSVALIDGRTLRGASKRFNIRRELKVTLTPGQEVYAPGERGSIDILATDQLGNPVRAELSLALVNQALLDRYADETPAILTFFQEGASRFTEFSLVSTCDWTYTALSKRTQAGGQESVVAQNDFEQLLAINGLELGLNPSNSILNFNCLSAHESVFNNARFQQLELPQLAGQQLVQLQQVAGGTYAIQSNSITPFFAGQAGAIAMPDLQEGAAGGGFAGRALANPSDTRSVDAGAPQFDATSGRLNFQMPFDFSGAGAAPTSNSSTVWLSPITTGDDGKARAELSLPDTAGSWPLTARGCTTDTLVGQTTGRLITRRDFLVELRTPDVVQEGDTMSFIATVHNLTDYAGDAGITLEISGGPQPYKIARQIRIEKDSSTELLLGPYTVPFAGSLSYELAGEAGPAPRYVDGQPARPPVGDRVRRLCRRRHQHRGGHNTNTSQRAELCRPESPHHPEPFDRAGAHRPRARAWEPGVRLELQLPAGPADARQLAARRRQRPALRPRSWRLPGGDPPAHRARPLARVGRGRHPAGGWFVVVEQARRSQHPHQHGHDLLGAGPGEERGDPGARHDLREGRGLLRRHFPEDRVRRQRQQGEHCPRALDHR